MTTTARLRAAGLTISVRGDTLLVEPSSAITEELRAFIRSNKPALLQELRAAQTARQCRLDQAIRQLSEVPTRRAAYIAGDETDGVIPVTAVLRTPDGMITGDLAIPEERWDSWLFLESLEEAEAC